ncbi:hypothetical protein [Saccharibacter floricola]|uniref:Lipoprotein n=1 Tax=Saccharibacter floricola DSM 15669 TaxID=1123227 RepID=A0ABQ0P044_9PROT|nr:hypothetical protein [Saccharibacter floricola]GBQ07898.1 hypothetical protein AA15669_1585 [Saccharibacter floricola DSM 15669]
MKVPKVQNKLFRECLVLGIVSFFLYGCAAQKIKKAERNKDREVEKCHVIYPAKIGDYCNLSRCLDEALDKYSAIDKRYRAQVYMMSSIGSHIDRSIDDGDITPEEGGRLFFAGMRETQDRIMAIQRGEAPSIFDLQNDINRSQQKNCYHD